jgi:hypothetical protein
MQLPFEPADMVMGTRFMIARAIFGLVAALLAVVIVVRAHPGTLTWTAVRDAVRARPVPALLAAALAAAAAVFLGDAARATADISAWAGLDTSDVRIWEPRPMFGVAQGLACAALAAFALWDLTRGRLVFRWWALALAAGGAQVGANAMHAAADSASALQLAAWASLVAAALSLAAAVFAIVLLWGRPKLGRAHPPGARRRPVTVVLGVLMLALAGLYAVGLFEVISAYDEVREGGGVFGGPSDEFTPGGEYRTEVELEGGVVPAVLLVLVPFVPFAAWMVRTRRNVWAWWVLFAAFALVATATVALAAGEPTGNAALWAVRGLMATAALGCTAAAGAVAVLGSGPRSVRGRGEHA